MESSFFSSFSDEPISEFLRWLKESEFDQISQSVAMVLATATKDGIPSARVMLFKGIEDGGIVFFTNYRSRKSEELLSNPRASLVFYSSSLQRQVRFDGTVEKISSEASDQYWKTRPRESRIGAIASRQSARLDSRAAFDERVLELTRQFEGKGIPRPDFWGGFRLIPNGVEFWVARQGRLHERLRYERKGRGWEKFELYP